MRGYCQSGGKMHIARAKLHYWEEPPISGTRGSGTIFFTGCSLRCAFCQNSEISGESLHGKDFTVEEFIETIKKLEAMGAHNINLVTPTHFASQIAEALRIYKPRVPVVYNCGGYESVETLRMLEGLVDIYLPDFKYADDDLAVRLSNAPHYCETALVAIHEMVRQTGENVYDENGMLQKGIIIRQLILPGHTRNSMQALELIKQHFSGVPVSLMSQYTPMGRVLHEPEFADINRRITLRESRKVQNYMLELGLPGFCQKRSAAGERYIPDFTQFDTVNLGEEKSMQTTIQLLSPMKKVMAQEEKTFAPYPKASALRGEETAFQAIVTGEGEHYIEVRTDAPVKVAVYREGYVPCTLSAYPDRFDDDYITIRAEHVPGCAVSRHGRRGERQRPRGAMGEPQSERRCRGRRLPCGDQRKRQKRNFPFDGRAGHFAGAEAHVHAVVPWRLHRSALRRGDLRKRALGIVRKNICAWRRNTA